MKAQCLYPAIYLVEATDAHYKRTPPVLRSTQKASTLPGVVRVTMECESGTNHQPANRQKHR
jgi:hypothetical protein